MYALVVLLRCIVVSSCALTTAGYVVPDVQCVREPASNTSVMWRNAKIKVPRILLYVVRIFPQIFLPVPQAALVGVTVSACT